jgi:1-acyl-sn-glycerol-3-phosphate acyltransferase
MDLIKSLFTWIFSVLFIVLMFPLGVIIWLVTAPFGMGSLLVHRWLSFQGRVLVRVSPLWILHVTGSENYEPGENYVMISNHQSLLDIPVVESLKMDYRWVSKIENFRVPVLGQSMHLAGYISLKRGDKESVIKMMQQSEKVLRKGESVFIFPEGTRSPDSEIKKFKSGAFRLAMQTNTPVLPVIIDGTGAVLPKKGFVFSSGHKLEMKILKPVYPSEFMSNDPDDLASAFQSMMQKALEDLRQDIRENSKHEGNKKDIH